MQKALYILMLMAYMPIAQAQHLPATAKIKYGIESAWITDATFNLSQGITAQTAVTATTNHHSLALGIVWWKDFISPSDAFRGASIGYRYLALPAYKNWCFYLQYTLLYTFKETAWNKSMLYGSLTTQDVQFNSRWDSMKHLFGYGLSYHFYKGFYVSNNLNVGIEFYHYQSETKVSTTPSLSNKYVGGSLFTDGKICSMVQLAAGYRF